MKWPPKRSAPGREIAGAAKLRLWTAYVIAKFLATDVGAAILASGSKDGRGFGHATDPTRL